MVSRDGRSRGDDRHNVDHRRRQPMLNPADPARDRHRPAVRDGQLAPVTCDTCGCRLEPIEAVDGRRWFHFGRLGGRDARGCRVACVDAIHDTSGRPAIAA
jgi:hypothetical protein